MSLPPPDQRATTVLQKEVDNLKDTYKNCAEILGPNITPAGARALDRINDAILALSTELESRGA
ncbi:hypothetical protein [Azospirillum himalayense]|uniref:Uncharacterized protein n=1 Tax=Azospirillum himalayense TaxID=654847 RepID=A0ABW0GC15_9PROT